MEVLVSFIGGDADRPMILGAAYNATHPVPFLLPVNKTQSGIRTQSSPGGEGFNELSFEDARAMERIYVHAQRDLDEVVLRDHTLVVHADETLRVQANRRDTVGENVTYEVLGDREETVHGDTYVRHVGSRVDVVEKALDSASPARAPRASRTATTSRSAARPSIATRRTSRRACSATIRSSWARTTRRAR